MVCACNVKSAGVEEGIRGGLSWPTRSLSCLVPGGSCSADRDRQAGNAPDPPAERPTGCAQPSLPSPSHPISVALIVATHRGHRDWRLRRNGG